MLFVIYVLLYDVNFAGRTLDNTECAIDDHEVPRKTLQPMSSLFQSALAEFAKTEFYLRLVYPSVWINSAPTGRIFMKCGFF